MVPGPPTTIERYTGRPGAARTISVAGFIDMAGAGLHLGSLPIFLVRFADVAPAQIGYVVGVTGLVGLLAPYLAGYLSDRVGPLPLWRWTVALRVFGYGAFALVDSVWSYALLVLLLTPLDRATSNAQMAYLVSAFAPDERNTTTAAVRTCRNAGLAAGLLGSSFVVAIDTVQAFQIAFLVNALSFALYFVALLRLRPIVRERSDADEDGPARPAVAPWRNGRYLALTLGDGLMSLHFTVLFVVFPLWVAAHEAVPTELVGVLLAVNAVLTVVLQVPLSHLAVGLRDARRMARWAGLALVACGGFFGVASATGSTPVAVTLTVLGMLALTLGENLQEVATFEASHRLAPDGAIGRYLGMFSLGDSAQRIAGPPALTALLVAVPAGWLVFMGASAAGAALAHLSMRGRDE